MFNKPEDSHNQFTYCNSCIKSDVCPHKDKFRKAVEKRNDTVIVDELRDFITMEFKCKYYYLRPMNLR